MHLYCLIKLLNDGYMNLLGEPVTRGMVWVHFSTRLYSLLNKEKQIIKAKQLLMFLNF